MYRYVCVFIIISCVCVCVVCVVRCVCFKEHTVTSNLFNVRAATPQMIITPFITIATINITVTISTASISVASFCTVARGGCTLQGVCYYKDGPTVEAFSYDNAGTCYVNCVLLLCVGSVGI